MNMKKSKRNRELKKILIKHLIVVSLILNISLIGAVLNLAVISENGGRMPVYFMEEVDSEKHFSFTNFEEVKFPYLSDIIHLEGKKYYANFSIGDILIVGGFILAPCERETPHLSRAK